MLDRTRTIADSAARGAYRVLKKGPAARKAERLEHRTARLEDEVSALRQDVARVLDRVVEFEIRSRRDTVYAGDCEAALQSNHFARENMLGARHFRRPWETLQHAVSLAPTGGMALEFGVATGNTLRQIARIRDDGQVFGFDSFEGLPEPWLVGMQPGMFAKDELPDVPGAELVVGWFDDTLPEFLEQHPGHVDLLHVDSDLYSSAKTVLDLVGPRLRPGSVIVFDEYFNFPDWQQHEHKAWQEYVERTGVTFTYEAYTFADRQVVVRLTG